MKAECEVIRDLLPLYADEACSETSRGLVEAHLAECDDCRAMLGQLRETTIEDDLHSEMRAVLQYGKRRFRRRSAAVGGLVSGLFMIPILVLLIVNLVGGFSLSWFYVVLASLAVAASLILVPVMVPEDKAFWTLCAFCASLMTLLGVVCLYTHGRWFWIASSATLFGLAVAFLPFAIRAKPVKRLIGDSKPWVIVVGLDVALFVNMMNMISSNGRFTLGSALYTLGVLAGIGVVVNEILRSKSASK